MTTSFGSFRVAARDVDPLSWFTGPYVPLVFAVLVSVYGGTMTYVTWLTEHDSLLQLIGVALCTAACLLIQWLTSLRTRVDNLLGAVVVVVGGAGLIVSALGYTDATFSVELWWAPFCLALVMACVVPYLAAWRILFFGVLTCLTVVPVAFVIIADDVPIWGPVAVYLFVATPVLVCTASGTAFVHSIVQQVLPIVDSRSTTVISEVLELDPEDEEAERVSLARFTSRAVPFLREVATRGTVDPTDRVLAGELARYLRDDLVSRSSLAWLGLRAEDRRVVVIDPDHRADTMRSPQRAAIRDLVRAVLDDPATDATTLLIELRAHDDGSTAVAITLDTHLPEGRRVRHLSPYYFNLRGEMRDVKLSRDGLSFRIPPAEQ